MECKKEELDRRVFLSRKEKKTGQLLENLEVDLTPTRKDHDHILACTLSELPASHDLRFGGDLQYVLLRWVEVIDGRSEQVLDEGRLIPVLGVLSTHFRALDVVKSSGMLNGEKRNEKTR